MKTRTALLCLTLAVPSLVHAALNRCSDAHKRMLEAAKKEEAAKKKAGGKESEESKKWAKVKVKVEADCDVIRLCPLREGFDSKAEEYAHHRLVWKHTCPTPKKPGVS